MTWRCRGSAVACQGAQHRSLASGVGSPEDAPVGRADTAWHSAAQRRPCLPATLSGGSDRPRARTLRKVLTAGGTELPGETGPRWPLVRRRCRLNSSCQDHKEGKHGKIKTEAKPEPKKKSLSNGESPPCSMPSSGSLVTQGHRLTFLVTAGQKHQTIIISQTTEHARAQKPTYKQQVRHQGKENDKKVTFCPH